MTEMIIRQAVKTDIPDIERLLRQICSFHSESRPDLFRKDGQKYNAEEIEAMIEDESRPLIVAFDEESSSVLGYAMCKITQIHGDTALCDRKTIYLDDLCVDSSHRSHGIGRKIFEYLKDFSKSSGCYDLTLNVWADNERGRKFYDSLGMKPQKTTLELIL